MSKRKYPLLDLSFVKDFTFVAGVGAYGKKRACIMSALYLATQIAQGRITLAEATDPTKDGISEYDRLECVSPCLRRILISHNDTFAEDIVGNAARKDWAVDIIRSIPGTFLGDRFENKVQTRYDQIRLDTLHARAKAELEKNLDFDTARYIRDYNGDSLDVDFDMQEILINGLLEFIETEKSRRLQRNERQRLARAAKKAAQ